MRLALDGDREAYRKLMTELGGAIEAYLRGRFGSFGGADLVEDCVQESLLAIHRARQTWDPRRPFRPWLFTIVRHKAIDLLRRERVRRTEPIEDVDAPAAPPVEPSARLDGARLLEDLEPKYREALVLTKLEGYSIQDAARRAGVSVPAMKTRIHRGLKAVQKRLRAEDSE